MALPAMTVNHPLSIAREPLVHFLLIGAALFLINEGASNPGVLSRVQATTSNAQIVVSQDDLDQLNTQFARTWQRLPNREEQKALAEDFVRSEVLYREALALGLDRGDPEIRRRLRQRMEFLYEDVGTWVEPSIDDLTAFMNSHSDRYVTDTRIAFRQVFVSASKRGARAESDAEEILAQLGAGANPDSLGDPTMLESDTPLAPRPEIARQFGEKFSALLFEAAPGTWVGPIPSGYGLHLVAVTRRDEGRMPPLEEIRGLVQRDWTIDRQNQLKDASYATIRSRYDVRIEGRTP